MSIADTRRDQMFPVLNAAQVESIRRFASGEPRQFAPGETTHQVGDRNAPAWLVLRGSIEIALRDGLGHETGLPDFGVGQFTGEMNSLAGKRALTVGRAGKDGCVAIPFDGPHLRALMVGSAEIGEIFMRAFILRRVALIQEGGAGSVLAHPTTVQASKANTKAFFNAMHSRQRPQCYRRLENCKCTGVPAFASSRPLRQFLLEATHRAGGADDYNPPA